MFVPIKLLSQQTILIAAFNSILMINKDEILYSIGYNYSNSLAQWYCYLISQCIMGIWSLAIPFKKLKIIELLIVELYLTSNGMIVNKFVTIYGVSSNITLILFRILWIILILENRNYIQVYYKIRPWQYHLLLQFVMIILFPILSVAFCKCKIMQLLIIELYLILNGMIMNIYSESSNNTLTLFRILIMFICENMDSLLFLYSSILQNKLMESTQHWYQMIIAISKIFNWYDELCFANRIRLYSKRIIEFYNNYSFICQIINYNLRLFCTWLNTGFYCCQFEIVCCDKDKKIVWYKKYTKKNWFECAIWMVCLEYCNYIEI